MNSIIIEELRSLEKEFATLPPDVHREIRDVIDRVLNTNVDGCGAVKIINTKLNILSCEYYSKTQDATFDDIRRYLAPIDHNDYLKYWALDIKEKFIPGFKWANRNSV